MKILIPTDFSSSTSKALSFIDNLGISEDLSIYLLHVLKDSVNEDIKFSRQDWVKGEISLKNFHTDYIQAIDDTLKNHKLVKEIICVTGSLEDHIIEKANSGQYDLIMSPTHGTHELRDIIFGTTTQNLVHDSDIPVLSLLDDYQLSRKKRLLFVNEFNENIELDLEPLRSFLKVFPLDLYLLKVVGESVNDHLEKQKIKAFAKRHQLEFYNYFIKQARTVDEGLHEFLEENEVSIVALATHGRKGIKHFFLGSIAEDLIDRIKVPVLSFKMNTL